MRHATSDDGPNGARARVSLNALSLLAAADFVVDFGDGRRSRREESATHGPQTHRIRTKCVRLAYEASDLCDRIGLFLTLAQAPDDSLVSDVHLFELLRAVHSCNERLRLLHRALLSLFPAVTAELVEAVRLATVDPETLPDPWGTSSDRWSSALARTHEVLTFVRTELSISPG